MKIGRVFAFALASAAAAAGAAPQPIAPMSPIKPWLVDYAPSHCHAERTYGSPADPITFAIRSSPTGDTYELLVQRKKRGPWYARELPGSVDFGRGPIKAWLLHTGVRGQALSFYKFRISGAEMAQARSANSVTLHVSGAPDVAFRLNSMPALLSELDKCTEDLQHYWNMTPAEQARIATPAKGDVRSVFTFEDYPAEALASGQEGGARFALLVDERGDVAACYVAQPSGIAALDGMGCQVIRDRAKFKPAIGVDGKPVRSGVVTPQVVWRMSS